MPTKRRFLLFLVVLAVMLLIKYAAGQEEAQVGWDVGHDPIGSIEGYVQGTMIFSVIWGALAGAVMVARRNRAAREGHYFSGDLVTVRIER